MKNPAIAQKKSGFTLMEALFAVLLLATGIFIVITVSYRQFSYINRLREQAIAMLASQEVIERIRTMPFDNIVSQDLSARFNGAQHRPKALSSYLNNPTVTVTKGSGYGSSSNITQASVVVSWDSFDGRRLQKSLATIVTRGGIDKQ